jgi:hypothetical protein
MRICGSISGPKFVLYKSDQQIYLTLGQLIAKGRHSVPAFGNMTVYLCVGPVLEFAYPKVRHLSAIVESLPFGLGPVADRTVLPEERRFVCFAFGCREPSALRVGTGEGEQNQKNCGDTKLSTPHLR